MPELNTGVVPTDLVQAVLDSIQEPISVIDRERRIMYANRAARQLAEADLSDIICRCCYQRFWGRPAPCEHCLADATFQEEEPLRCSATVRARDGTDRHIEIQTYPLRVGPGRPAYMVEVVRDVTEQRQLEEKARRNEVLASVGEVAAVVAHEVRNPLGAMITALDLLDPVAGRAVTPEDVTLHDVLRREAARLKAIVTDFLQFARPSPAQAEPLDLEVLLDDVIGGLRRTQPDRARAVITREPVGGLPRVLADPSKLRQALWNIGQNALEAMPDGGTLVFAPRPSGDTVQLDITDSGEGIEAGRLEQVFQPFYTTRERGTGLGLTIARRLAEAQDGSLTVRSAPHQGTTFTMSLPAAPALEGRPHGTHTDRG